MTAQHALLSFMVGSPQAIIESSRTLRDLWSGSYLVSWIVGRQAAPCNQLSKNWEAIVSLHRLPGLSQVAAILLAQWHGQFGNWPFIRWAIRDDAVGAFVYPETARANLNQLRESARSHRSQSR